GGPSAPPQGRGGGGVRAVAAGVRPHRPGTAGPGLWGPVRGASAADPGRGPPPVERATRPVPAQRGARGGDPRGRPGAAAQGRRTGGRGRIADGRRPGHGPPGAGRGDLRDAAVPPVRRRRGGRGGGPAMTAGGSVAASWIERLDAVMIRLQALAGQASGSSEALTQADPQTGERWEEGQVWSH